MQQGFSALFDKIRLALTGWVRDSVGYRAFVKLFFTNAQDVKQ